MTDSDRIAALERRVAELERQRMWHIPQMPTFPQPLPPTPSADTWSGIMEVCRVRGTYGRSDYITTGNRMDNRCNLRVTFDGSELIKAEVARPPNTPDGMRMFAVIDMSAPIPPTPTPSQQEALTETQIRELWERTFSTSNPFCPCDLRSFTKTVRATESEISRPAARPDTEGVGNEQGTMPKTYQAAQCA